MYIYIYNIFIGNISVTTRNIHIYMYNQIWIENYS